MRRLLAFIVLVAVLLGCGKTPDGKPFETAPPNETPAKTDLAALSVKPARTFKVDLGGSSTVTFVHLSPDGTRLALYGGPTTPTDKRRGEVWDVSGTPKKLREQKGPFGHLSADGKKEVLWGTVRELDTGKALGNLRGLDEMRFRGNEALVGWSVDDSRVRVFKHAAIQDKEMKELFRLGIPPHPAKIYHQSGGTEAFVGYDDTPRVEVYDLTTGKKAREITLAAPMTAGVPFVVAPGGRYVWTLSGKWQTVFDGASGAVVMRTALTFFRFHPNTDLASGGERYDGKDGLLVLDLAAKKPVAYLPGAKIVGSAVTGDGKTVYSCDGDGLVSVWDLSPFVR